MIFMTDSLILSHDNSCLQATPGFRRTINVFIKTSIMKKFFTWAAMIFSTQLPAQDNSEKKAVIIFNSDKAINANTTELVGKGKMAFKVTHNFGDIGGNGGGIKNFFGWIMP